MAYLIPYTILAQGIYTGIISTISTTTMGACKIITSLYGIHNPDTVRYIKELDIVRRMNLIRSVLNIIDKESPHLKLGDLEKTLIFEMTNVDINLNKDPIELCLLYLQDTTKRIHKVLTKIKNKVEYHNTKWFSSWRILNVDQLLGELKLHSDLLTARFDDLTKISLFLSSITGGHK